MKRPLTRIMATLAIIVGMALPAQALYSHPCTSHQSHTAKMLIPAEGSGIWSHTAKYTYGDPNDIWYSVYWKPSAQHSNWTLRYSTLRICG